MAEFILSPLLDVIFGNLASLATKELRLVWGVDEELENLKSTLSAIRAVLEDAEDGQSESRAVKDWLEKLQDVAYDADELVDDMAIDAQKSKMESETEFSSKKMRQQVCNFLPSYFNCSTRVGYRWETAHRIKKINEKLHKIANEREELHLETRSRNKQFEIREGRRQPIGSVKDESQVTGREKEKEKIIVSLLSDDSRNRRFSVIAIVGMGGVAKTTLAQLVYNDEKVTSKFEVRAWVCVSEDFDVIRLTKEIIESARPNTNSCDLSSIDALQCRLLQILKGKRFLLVLDDVWNEHSSYWEQLQEPFSYGEKGSKIVVTTRKKTVSEIMQSVSTCDLEPLSKEDCWTLFRSRAFVDEDEEAVINANYPRLVEIGRKLVDKCQGLPLAAKALGGLLSSERNEREWENVLKSKTWELHGEGGRILPALRLSYQDLPAHLKRCFSFCSVYEKDHEFDHEQLVQMWIAHGFVQGKDGEQIEDTGSRYFNDLVKKSFFQYSWSRPSKKRYYLHDYTMHDLFHDLAQSISGTECFYASNSEQWHRVPRKARHLSLNLKGINSANFGRVYELRGLRTLLFRGNWNWTNEMFNSLKSLRVLELRICDIPNCIGNLRHLRYLKIENKVIKELPNSICNIYYLEALILYCAKLVKLPNEMSKLEKLRHLKLEYCPDLESTPPGIGRLAYLQNLSVFFVSKEKERGIEQLENLIGLRGSLQVRNLEQVENAHAAQQANLKSKTFIDELELSWSDRELSDSIDEMLEEEVAERLEPYPNVKKLHLCHYMGTRFPSWMMKMDTLLRSLTEVSLNGCRRCSILPPLGQLPFLVELSIHKMDEVKHIAEGQFPRLKSLSIYSCSQLISLPCFPSLESLWLQRLDNLEDWCGVGETDFRNLSRLVIQKCPKLTRWPINPSTLSYLIVSECRFDSLPLIPPLKSLTVGEVSDGLWNCVSSLTSLTLTSPELTAVPQGILRALTQLKTLYIDGCDKLETFLEEDDVPPTFTVLFFRNCKNMKSLPRGLQNLTSLRVLVIRNCPEVASLPEEGLPSGLQRLHIGRCPKLEKRCGRDTGGDWPKISRIPHVHLGNPDFWPDYLE